ncbi:MAG: nicotinamide riboside transporter PnuC [Flavobacteriaceae bacterium]|nr:nicotinamide riboside transporter PnuC [Flavobacteriaceae bacterium]MDC1459478.1 nicotinamide riboside transporter PnuC [Flavobacteriaceae bacterium]MDG1031273.1 nicotinamide riboside transporter PnuC [Flavobacteriaceae bacterium]MDG1343415.1 nicotinamide riboside transporter PnuC [Flavobacteriaceae bacterium]MDG2485851.1 nicotinamide riboside transporter PnuC [Flavobacteriaceae bacterium]|tara:strand:- start:601 stop:1230 length:630 start_codon:yes stop_codon:yes gene_type:complete
MSEILNFLFEQYSQSQTIDIILEITAVIFGLLSVWYSKNNNILVFPTGMISTSIFIYLLYKWVLLGDMLINAYYFIMSIYGWYIWTRKKNDIETPITTASSNEKKIGLIIFLSSLVFVYLVYVYFDKWGTITSYIDNLTTAIFFVGMWLMAKRKIENWIFWIIADIISIPLYFYKGFTFTSLQYLIFTFIAIAGYYSWKNILNKSKQAA